MKYMIAWPVAWSVFWLGHLSSIFVEWLYDDERAVNGNEAVAFRVAYSVYTRCMGLSYRVCKWAGGGIVWHPAEEEE